MPSEMVELLPRRQRFDSSTWPEGWDGYGWLRYGGATCGDCVHFKPCPNDECELGVCDWCLHDEEAVRSNELWWVVRSETWCGDDSNFRAVPR